MCYILHWCGLIRPRIIQLEDTLPTIVATLPLPGGMTEPQPQNIVYPLILVLAL